MKVTLEIKDKTLKQYSEGLSPNEVKKFLKENQEDVIILYLVSLADEGDFPPNQYYDGDD